MLYFVDLKKKVYNLCAVEHLCVYMHVDQFPACVYLHGTCNLCRRMLMDTFTASADVAILVPP